MKFLSLRNDYSDPESLHIESVERKGVGHPDSLADALANEVSIAFSRYCLQRFGLVLHHNIDKLFIGAGNVYNDYGSARVVHPFKVVTNGRMTNKFGNEDIDVESIQSAAIWNYLARVLPAIQRSDVDIQVNSTQFHRVATQYQPQDRSQIHYLRGLKANDTSVCVSHWPPTVTESITYRLERYFWTEEDGYAVPRFPEIGQDIKVFTLRRHNHLEVTLCVPTMSRHTRSKDHYREIINHHEKLLQAYATRLAAAHGLDVTVKVNQHQGPYMLGLGSCIECGEEGLVGRGNNILGIISTHRVHTQESWAGKNPVYHTGRVLGYLTLKLAKAISEKLNVKCSVMAMTQCAGSLIPPTSLSISTNEHVDEGKVKEIVESDLLSANYLEEILSFRPWMLHL